jgi:hypothetical protein
MKAAIELELARAEQIVRMIDSRAAELCAAAARACSALP